MPAGAAMSKLTRRQVEVRRRWTEALRSGRYRQTTGKLRALDGGYCCLGVLCDVVAPHLWDAVNCLHSGQFAYPPDHVADAAHLPPNSGAHRDRWFVYEGDIALWELNDIRKFTFSEIADVIDLDTLMRQDGCL